MIINSGNAVIVVIFLVLFSDVLIFIKCFKMLVEITRPLPPKQIQIQHLTPNRNSCLGQPPGSTLCMNSFRSLNSLAMAAGIRAMVPHNHHTIISMGYRLQGRAGTH